MKLNKHEKNAVLYPSEFVQKGSIQRPLLRGLTEGQVEVKPRGVGILEMYLSRRWINVLSVETAYWQEKQNCTLIVWQSKG